MNITAAILSKFPDLKPWRPLGGAYDFRVGIVNGNQAITEWKTATPAQPTSEELQQWDAGLQAAKAIGDAMMVTWNALPVGVQALFDSVRVAVNRALKRGDLALARSLISTAPVPAELEASRSTLLEAIPQ